MSSNAPNLPGSSAAEPLLRARRSGPLTGACRVPGDKSVSHRALLFGALCDGTVAVHGLGEGGDNRSTARALQALGVGIRLEGTEAEVHGVGFDGLRASSAPLDCGNSGTTIRMMTGLLAGRPFATTLFGDASLTKRPMRRLAEPLRLMGARIDGRSDPARPNDVFPPLEVRGGSLKGVRYDLPVASAQLKSAMVLAGLQATGRTELREPATSRDHTERMLRHLGAPVTADSTTNTIVVDPAGWGGRLRAMPLTVPGDLSSATFLIVAALGVPGSDVVIENVGLNPTRTGALDALAAMGAELTIEQTGDAMGEPVGRVRVRARKLRGTHVGGTVALRAIDEVPALAVAAALAEGTTTFSDLKELRIKESDRIAALARELGRAGVQVEERPDGLVVEGLAGRAPKGGTVQPEHDHRIAMAGAVLGLASPDETIVPSSEIATSFPSFADTLRALGASLDSELR
ncbi:MAG TPA: 3-phosphoshikimate 1-carboxyvinyltransferase [Polyangia bacterium]|jgi:3-phosphoshikimate 1-carboxyvinyltransferase|nr:3-phosphoshikimate 1-carboxyvinyltransferase [Polyangia bacterium]